MCSSATAYVGPKLLKFPAVLSDTVVRRFAIDREDLDHAGNQKSDHISLGYKPIIYSIFKKITNHRKKTNRQEQVLKKNFH